MKFDFAKSLTLTLSCSLLVGNLPAFAEASTVGEQIQLGGSELVSSAGASEVSSATGQEVPRLAPPVVPDDSIPIRPDASTVQSEAVVSSTPASADLDAEGLSEQAVEPVGEAIASSLERLSSVPVVGEVRAAEVNPIVSAQLESINKEVLEKELQLFKLNTTFRIETTERNRRKPWRVFFYNLMGSSVATAGITTIAAERWRTWRSPAKAKRGVLKAGPILLLTSHSIMTGGILIEAFLDAVNDHKQKKKGFDPKTMQKRATELRDAIDQKLTERNQVVNSLGSVAAAELAQVNNEGLVLQDLRNLAMAEYVQFHVRAKKRTLSRNVAYLNGFFSATTGGYLGSLMGLLAVTNRNPRYAGPAGIGFTLSGMSIVAGPILGRMAGNAAGALAKSQLKRQLGPVAPAHLAEHITTLKACSAGGEPRLSTRIAIYEETDGLLARQAKMNAAEKKKADKEYRERLIANAMIGGTKMAWGIQLMNAGFNFHQVPKPQARPSYIHKAQTPAQVFAHRVAQGSTSYIPGTSLWILDTLQARARGEMDVYTMGQQSALPHQKLKDRLDRLEAMETKLKTSY